MAEQVDKVSIRVLVEKGKNKVVYAEAGKDFVDVLFSFLTLPLGTIAKVVAKDTNIKAVKFGSISSLYQSVANLDEKYLWSNTCKSYPITSVRSLLAKFKIDDLVVTPVSSIDGISYLERMKVPINDVEEIVISIGQKEGLSILKASLTSTSVLTNSLNQYIGSRAAQADLSSNASLKDRPLKKSSMSFLHFISFICYPFKRG
ncbi:hypothetical protein TSUD_162970 [Trifolium subterraneum]|uniref:DUF674 family protein n=1 Tax=Trifolium subterraneum TaxID=3900 RepID=A0A2Z6N5L3_TRISU|nr:hypothetical protein TSUD_162970 [Trifolium subterraneum]